MKIPAGQLQPGDVLLYHGRGFLSDMIRLFDGSEYSHAAFFNGQKVVEALGSGITARELAQSVADAKYVDVYRFVSSDGKHLGDSGYAAQPILDAAARFVAAADRYAYEQIVLLAVLASTRRIPVVSDIPFLRWILRNVLDNAADVVSRMVAAGKEPMICSELVYRCYAESGPQYRLIIRGADTMRALAIPIATTAVSPAAVAHAHEAAAIEAELDAFRAKYAIAKHAARARTANAVKAPGKKSVKPTARMAAARALAVADFVTPRDLRDSPGLFRVGTLQA